MLRQAAGLAVAASFGNLLIQLPQHPFKLGPARIICGQPL
jgi:hypothetical protein